MSYRDLREAFRDIPGVETLQVSRAENGNQIITIENRSVEVGPMASNDEIRFALLNPWIRTENTRMSITGYEPGTIQAKLADIKQKAADRRAASMAKLDAALAKTATVDDQLEAEASRIEKEADAALHEFAAFTNGSPYGDETGG
ncbi:hypothetical protein IVB27_32385 [Bradyrhizobium sp. 197]|uniref:hypothetical protein n=1 Tax=Bradyrhizobium sp. 197 TaxID=2782663 RepID=UPI001FF9E878|nr:hypothetical protein [Bradyrhizobium sp. 197]MCK1479313.1 hypothetical protein [Bradyrhizobium sp. 197]